MKVADPVQHYRKDAEIFDYFSPHSRIDEDTERRIRQAVAAAASAGSHDLVLDLGSGNGWLSRALAASGAAVVSLDAGQANLKVLRTRIGPSALLVCADALRLPFRSGVLTGVVAAEILEHLNEPGEALAECHRVLRPGGTITLSTPYAEVIKHYLCIHCNRPTPANAHLHAFDESAHAAMLRGAGFTDVRFRKLMDRVFVASRLSYILRFLPYRLWRAIDRSATAVFGRATMIVATARKGQNV